MSNSESHYNISYFAPWANDRISWGTYRGVTEAVHGLNRLLVHGPLSPSATDGASDLKVVKWGSPDEDVTERMVAFATGKAAMPVAPDPAKAIAFVERVASIQTDDQERGCEVAIGDPCVVSLSRYKELHSLIEEARKVLGVRQ